MNRAQRAKERYLERRRRFIKSITQIFVTSVVFTVVVLWAANWYFNLPVVHVSDVTNEVVYIEQNGRPVPPEQWRHVLAGKYVEEYVRE